MLDLDAIRARHEPYADTRVGQDIAALLSELDRLTAELAAAQAELTAARRGPVVEWRTRIDVEEATPGDFGLVVGEGGWTLEFFDKHGDAVQVIDGCETGPEGKAAAEAAYLKAAGLA